MECNFFCHQQHISKIKVAYATKEKFGGPKQIKSRFRGNPVFLGGVAFALHKIQGTIPNKSQIMHSDLIRNFIFLINLHLQQI